jgi:hypothetical protein
MKGILRACFAIVVASAAPAFVAAVIQLGFDSYASLSSVRATFLGTLFIAAGHVFILGLPIALWLRRSGTFRLSNMIVAGFLVGALPTLSLQVFPWLLRLVQRSAEPILPGLLSAVAAGVFGCIGSFAFFLVCRREWGPVTSQQGASTA